jgi:hypothetical protein
VEDWTKIINVLDIIIGVNKSVSFYLNSDLDATNIFKNIIDLYALIRMV